MAAAAAGEAGKQQSHSHANGMYMGQTQYVQGTRGDHQGFPLTHRPFRVVLFFRISFPSASLKAAGANVAV